MGVLSHRTFSVMVGSETFLIPLRCTHRQGILRCGDLNKVAGRITCPLHHACFDVRTGRRLAGPDCPDRELDQREKGDTGVGA